MSAKRKFKRTQLRVVTSDESAFREVIALVEAFLEMGFGYENISPGFVPNPHAALRAISPIVILRQGQKALTYRLDNHVLAGTQENVEVRWREWVNAIRGGRSDISRLVTRPMYEESKFASKGGKNALRDAVLAAKIEIPKAPEPDPSVQR